MKSYQPMETSARFSHDQTPNTYYDMSTGMQVMDMGRQAGPIVENQKEQGDMKMSLMPKDTVKARFTRNDKDAKVNEKIIEKNTSSTKIA